MQRITHHIPDSGMVTINLLDMVNDMIDRGEPDSEVIHVALTGLFGVVGQLEAARRAGSDQS